MISQGIFVAGGSGQFASTQVSVEFLPLPLQLGDLDSPGPDDGFGRWMEMPPMSVPRCCWPQVGVVGTGLAVLGGERGPSNSVEVFHEDASEWRETDEMQMATRRAQMRAVFVDRDKIRQKFACKATKI